MDGQVNAVRRSHRGWRRKAGLVLLVLLALLVLLHRPILHSIGRAVAIHYAAKADLKLDCRLEGSVFGSLAIRNLHLVPTGPSPVESIDADLVQADYSLWELLWHGLPDFLQTVEARSVRVVLNPAKASLKAKIPDPKKKIWLPTIFPEQIRLSDVNVLVRTEPQDFVIEHLDLDLNPSTPGELRLRRLQVPTAPEWRNIAATTSYTSKKLVLQDLNLDAENQFRLLAIDASQIRAKQLAIALDSTLAHGTIAGTVIITQTGSSLDTKVRLAVDHVSLDTLRGYMGRPEGFLSGEVEHMQIDGSGTINAPRTWNGTVGAQISNLKQNEFSFDTTLLSLTARDGTATLDSAEVTKGANKIGLKASVELPDDIRAFGRRPIAVEFSGALPDLQSLTAGFPQPVVGSATVNGRADINEGTLRADVSFAGNELKTGTTTLEKFSGPLRAVKVMPPPGVAKTYYDDLRCEAHIDAANIQSGDHLFDSLHADISSVNDAVTLQQLTAARKQNTLVVHGDYRLPDDVAKINLQPANLEVSLGATELADYWIEGAAGRISGPLQITGGVKVRDGLANGAITVSGTNLRARTLAVPSLQSTITITNSVVYLNDLTVKLNDRDYIAASGQIGMDKPYPYNGKIAARIADLAAFKSLLAETGNKNELAGSVVLDWAGSGKAAEFQNSGQLKVTLEKGRYANLKALQANVDATYTPDGLDIPIVFLGSDKMDLQMIVQAKGSTLEVSKLQVDQGKAKYGVGSMSFPFVWKNIGSDRPVVPSDGKVAINFQSENLDIKKLFEDIGAKPVGSGLVNVKFDAQGTLGELSARLDVQMRDLRAEQLKNFETASLDLSAQLEHNQLRITGKLQQAKIQPVQLDASLPFDLAKTIHERRFDEANTPVNAKVRMPRSSVNFVRQFVPALNELDGDIALDVNIGGTIAKPEWSGAGDMTVNVARFANPILPALQSFKARLLFARDTLTFEKFGGDLAGGPFTLTGRATLPKLTELMTANLDFQLKADSVLVARNDTLTARADAAIKISGPLNAASVTGNVSLTNSQFLKNIDLIPIGLPGRPAPQPNSDRPDFSIPNPPLRDWKFDVAIKTKDPFLIRGNLANGDAVTDLHLVGTGLHPGLQGLVRLENVEATLPFSRLSISQGFLYFDPSDSLNPKIDLQGTSLIRDYTVHVYVYGTTISPEAVFTSEPPLPQEEIISLLATGVTREELTGNNNVLAGRAAMLLVQQLYRKVFKKGQTTKSNSVFDKLQVDVGNVDPRTGQQSATARFKVNEQVVLVGDLGVGGDFRGLVKYLIRFK